MITPIFITAWLGYSGVTGSKPGKSNFKIFGQINCCKLRKNQYNYDNDFSGQRKTDNSLEKIAMFFVARSCKI